MGICACVLCMCARRHGARSEGSGFRFWVQFSPFLFEDRIELNLLIITFYFRFQTVRSPYLVPGPCSGFLPVVTNCWYSYWTFILKRKKLVQRLKGMQQRYQKLDDIKKE